MVIPLCLCSNGSKNRIQTQSKHPHFRHIHCIKYWMGNKAIYVQSNMWNIKLECLHSNKPGSGYAEKKERAHTHYTNSERPFQLFQSLEDMFTCVFICRHNTIIFVECIACNAHTTNSIDPHLLTHMHTTIQKWIIQYNFQMFTGSFNSFVCAFEASAGNAISLQPETIRSV